MGAIYAHVLRIYAFLSKFCLLIMFLSLLICTPLYINNSFSRVKVKLRIQLSSWSFQKTFPINNISTFITGFYVCPCYYYPIRCGAAGRESFVVAVDLKSGAADSDHWIKRGTALLLSLSA